MGKTMDKKTVIYGANHNVPLAAVKWGDVQQAILDEIGDEPITTALNGAKKVVEDAKKDKTLEKAYVKVGLVESNLVLRIKDVRTLIDKEIDTLLVKQFKQKKEAYGKMLALESKKGENGTVVSLDPKDKVIKPSAQSVATQRKLGEDGPLKRVGETYGDKDKLHSGTVVDDQKLQKDAFTGANQAPIVILAHGSPLGKVGGGKVHATQFGGKSPSAIVDYLKKSVPVTYSGVVYLDGCYTAAGNTPLNFGKQVYDGMVKGGYFYLQIKGNLGMARTVNGKECVTHAEIEKAYEDAKKEKEELAKQIPVLEKKYTDAYALIVGQMKQLDDEAKKAGRGGPSNYNTQEKKKFEELMGKVNENNSKKDNDSQIKPLRARLKEVTDIFNAPKYNIEALTGTWGPEKLPPKR